MASNSAPPFVAIELKNTHHVLGLLSRDVDSAGGADLAVLAPRALGVRAPLVDPVPNPAVPPIELRIPQSLLQATAVKGATWEQRNQAFSNPQNCLLVNGGVAPVAAGVAAPTFAFVASNAGMVTAFNVNIATVVGADLPYTVIVQEAVPQPGAEPLLWITDGKIPAGSAAQNNVPIRSGPGADSPPTPIPAGTWVYCMVAVPGRPLLLTVVQPA